MHTVVYPIDALRIGGAEQQLLELVRGLDKTRFRPIVVPVDSGGSLEHEFRAVPGVQVVSLNRSRKADVLRPLIRMTRILHTERASIIQPFLTPATFFGLLPAFVVGTPTKVVTERCGVRRVRGLGYATYRTIEDWLTNFVDAVVANSEAGRELLVSRGIPPDRIQVVYNGINPQRLVVDRARAASVRDSLNVPAGGHVITILASLTVSKGHDVLLRALATLSDTDHLAIVGDGPRRGELHALAESLGIAHRVTFFGFQRQVADFLAASDLLVCASRDNEGCSNSIVEAMALGVPVVATQIGGNPELIHYGVNGWLVPADNPPALARLLERVLVDAAARQRIAERARLDAQQRFSLQRMVGDYELLYDRLLLRRQSLRERRVTPVGSG